MIDFYYTVTRNEIRSTMPAVPVLVSAAGWTVPDSGKAGGYRLRLPALPAHVTERAADCGGFVATTRWKTRYRFSPSQYVTWLLRWRPHWAATMDLCCCDMNTQGVPTYPGQEEVARRQSFTTEMAYLFWTLYQHLPITWVLTLQGWHPDEYVRHAHALAPLIREMAETYYDAASVDDEDEQDYLFRVGVGSLCGRNPFLVQDIVSAIRDILGIVPLHLWGTKLALLRSPLALPGVASLDSAAWNGLWASEHEARRRSGLSEAEYCWMVSYPRYAKRVEKALRQPRCTSLFDHTTIPLSAVQQAPNAHSPLPDGLRYRHSGEGSGEQHDFPF